MLPSSRSEGVMFYEEKCVNGMWYWRGTPDGDWIAFNKDDLQIKIADNEKRADARIAELEAERDRLREALEEVLRLTNERYPAAKIAREALQPKEQS